MTFADKLTRLVERTGTTRAAELTGVTRRTLQLWMRGSEPVKAMQVGVIAILRGAKKKRRTS